MQQTKRVEERRRIPTRDASGKVYIVIEYVDVISVRTRGGTLTGDGQKSYALCDGRSVNWIDETHFEIVSGGVQLTVDR